MRNRPVLIMITLALAVLGSACGDVGVDLSFGEDGSGVALTKELEIDLDGVSNVEVSDVWDVTITTGFDTPGISIETDDNLADRVEIRLEDDRLVVSTKGKSFDSKVGFNATIRLPDVTEVKVTDVASVKIDGDAVGLQSVVAQDAAHLSAEWIETDEIKISASDVASVTLSGSARSVTSTTTDVASVELSGPMAD